MLFDKDLEDEILKERNNLKAEKLDMSFGEIMNIYEDEEFIISPDFQRAFRWDIKKQTNFIESIILGVPIPPIFVAEDENGKWELVDGLQRISTILSFFGKLKNIEDEKNNLILDEGALVKDLKGFTSKTLPSKLAVNIKRSICRVEILRYDSNEKMKYELFKRLNTNSEPLSPQEVRNAIFSGKFNNFIKKLANSEEFLKLVEPTKKQKNEMFCEELILRFFAFKHSLDMPKGVSNYLDEFMQNINMRNINFNYSLEEENFFKLINFINSNLSRDIFKAKNGQFTKNLFDSIIYILNHYFNNYANTAELFLNKIDLLKNDDEYNKITTKKRESRTEDRIKRALEIFK